MHYLNWIYSISTQAIHKAYITPSYLSYANWSKAYGVETNIYAPLCPLQLKGLLITWLVMTSWSFRPTITMSMT